MLEHVIDLMKKQLVLEQGLGVCQETTSACSGVRSCRGIGAGATAAGVCQEAVGSGSGVGSCRRAGAGASVGVCEDQLVLVLVLDLVEGLCWFR